MQSQKKEKTIRKDENKILKPGKAIPENMSQSSFILIVEIKMTFIAELRTRNLC